VPGVPGHRTQRLLDDVRWRGGEQHLADAGRVQGQPAADLADHRHRLAARDSLDVQSGQPLAHGEVDGVADGGVQVEQERGGDLPQLQAHRREQAEVPELPADLVAAVGPPDQSAPVGQLAEQPVRGGQRGAGAFGDLGQREPRRRGAEGVEDAERAGGDRAAGRGGASGHVSAPFCPVEVRAWAG
jgi:hypothetical protein